MKNPNFLILDEPTNDLDLLTLNKLEEFLLQFKGCLILVSHDRYFMDKLTDHLFIFKGNGIVEDHYCSYSEYREKQQLEEKETKQTEKATLEKPKTENTKNKLSFKEKYEYEQLEKEIEKLELEKIDLEAQLNNPNLDFKSINEITTKLGNVITQIDVKLFRWMELDELS